MLLFNCVATLTGTIINSANLDIGGHSLPMIRTSTGLSANFSSSIPFAFNLHVNAVQPTGWILTISDQVGQQRMIIDTSTMNQGQQLTGVTGPGDSSDVNAVAI